MSVFLNQAPVEVLHPQSWTLPVIFSSPHSGSCYPASFVDQSPLDPIALRQSEDFKVDELFAAAPRLGAPLIKANFPRAYCDPNREAYELDPDMFSEKLPAHVITSNTRIAAGIGTIPRIVTTGNDIYAGPLRFKDIQARLDTCYFPYHDALKKVMAAGIKKFGKILLVDCHSMPATRPAEYRTPPLADFILGDCYGNACPQQYSRPIAENLKSRGYSVRFNTPYAGGYITRNYGAPASGVSSLQIEVNRGLYMDQPTMTATDQMVSLQGHITDLIQTIGTLSDQQIAI